MSIEKIFEDMNYGSVIESDKEAKEWIEQHQLTFSAYLSGQWKVKSADSTRTDILDANSNEKLATIEHRTADLSEAVGSATEAQKQWLNIPALGRTRFLNNLAGCLSKNCNLLSKLESLSTGRLLQSSRNICIPQAVRQFEYFAGWSALLFKEKQHLKSLGVVVVCVPSNSSLLTAVQKIAPAIAAGNSVVVYLEGTKECTAVNLSLFCLAELFTELSSPSGLLNVLFDVKPLWKSLPLCGAIGAISYSGDLLGGREIIQYCAGSGTKLNLFLDYKYAFVIFETADVDSAIDAVIHALKLSYELGLKTKLLVQESVQTKIIKLLQSRFDRLRFGHSLDTSADVGPLAKLMFQEVVEHFKKIEAVEATQLHLARLDFLTFRTAKEANSLLNDSIQDVKASIWTENITLAMELVKSIDASTIWVNCYSECDSSTELENRKYSGGGRDGGEACLYQYLQPVWYSVPHHGWQSRQPLDDSCSSQNMETVKKAVDLAHKSQLGWKASRAMGRSKTLLACLDALVKHPVVGEVMNDVVIQQLYSWASACDKHCGNLKETAFNGQVLTIFEPLGVIAIVLSSDSPLLAIASLVFSAISMGNAVVVFYQGEHSSIVSSLVKQLTGSGLPNGIINVISENNDAILPCICKHDVQAVWQVGSHSSSTIIEYSSGIEHLQKTWVNCGGSIDWNEAALHDDVYQLHSCQTKAVWLPLGVTFAN